ncbi:hypothetical protein ACOME3_001410 [Neoechinorhynchus agilis]
MKLNLFTILCQHKAQSVANGTIPDFNVKGGGREVCYLPEKPFQKSMHGYNKRFCTVADKYWRTVKPKKPEENNAWFNRSLVPEYMPTLEADSPVSRDKGIHDNIKITEEPEVMKKQIQFLAERIEGRDRAVSELN